MQPCYPAEFSIGYLNDKQEYEIVNRTIFNDNLCTNYMIQHIQSALEDTDYTAISLSGFLMNNKHSSATLEAFTNNKIIKLVIFNEILFDKIDYIHEHYALSFERHFREMNIKYKYIAPAVDLFHQLPFSELPPLLRHPSSSFNKSKPNKIANFFGCFGFRKKV